MYSYWHFGREKKKEKFRKLITIKKIVYKMDFHVVCCASFSFSCDLWLTVKSHIVCFGWFNVGKSSIALSKFCDSKMVRAANNLLNCVCTRFTILFVRCHLYIFFLLMLLLTRIRLILFVLARFFTHVIKQIAFLLLHLNLFLWIIFPWFSFLRGNKTIILSIKHKMIHILTLLVWRKTRITNE